jgi:integrase
MMKGEEIFYGERQGELLGLKWEGVDIAHQKVQVRRSIARVGKDGFKSNEPKTARSRRSIALTTTAIEAMQQHRLRQEAMRQAAGDAWDEQGWVFCNTVGRPLEAGNVLRRSFWPLLKKANLPKIRFHDVRHSAASLLLSMDVHPKIVQEMLGHSTISMTLDTYSHVIPSLQEEAVSRLNALLTMKEGQAASPVAVTEQNMMADAASQKASTRHESGLRKRAQRDSNPRHSVPKTDALIH